MEGSLIREAGVPVFGVWEAQVKVIAIIRAHRGISFHVSVRGCGEIGAIKFQFSAAPKIMALMVRRLIGMEHDSSLSFRYPIGWDRRGDHITAIMNRIE